MRIGKGIASLCLAVCAACGATATSITMPELDTAAKAPDEAPPAQSVVPTLVPYPGLEVSYVANAEGEIYACRKRYYCYFDGSWFRADSMRGPWNFVEMKYVPGDLYRARGHLPPALEEKERGVLVSGRG